MGYRMMHLHNVEDMCTSTYLAGICVSARRGGGGDIPFSECNLEE